jgi:biotin synthase
MVMPRTIIRLAAGRTTLSEEQQMMCFMAGANAVFTGEKMLTTACNGWDEDREMFERWGLRPMESFEVEALREAVTSPTPLDAPVGEKDSQPVV